MKVLGKMLKHVRKNLAILTICVAVVSLSYWVLFNHYRTFNFLHNDPVYKIESKLLDLRLKIRGIQKPKSKVGILAIDEKAISEFGRWPFSRRYYGQAFANLKKLGVRWIGFDSIFSEPERTYLADAKNHITELKQAWRTPPDLVKNKMASLEAMMENSPSDELFASGISDFQNIVLGYFYFGSKFEADQNLGERPRFNGAEQMQDSALAFDLPEGRQLKDYFFIKRTHGIVANTPLVSSASPYFGFFSNDPDDDAINRWVTLVADVNGSLMPSLSLKTVAEYLNRDIFIFFDDIGIETIVLIDRNDESNVVELPIDPLGSGRILVNHLGPGGTFPHFSLADAYNDSFTPEQKTKLKDAVLLLGATATGTNDMRPNPFDPAIDGVENHAAVMDNIINRQFLKRPVSIYSIELLIVLGVGLLFAPIMMFSKALFSGIAVVLFLTGYYYVDKYLWFGQGIWAYMAIPCTEILTMFIATTIYKYMTEEAEKRKVKGAFQHYLSPDVINQVLDDPESLQLGGVKKELTVFFSDVRGFTTISESLTPEKLCELMNNYFTPMTSIILRSGGVLDKYIGDAIMAFWGAPIDLPQHPDVACQASLDMLVALDQLRADFQQRGLPTIDMGIGLNTGLMSVGNMGSNERFTYTVMGDSVNLGARLEGLTKEYGIKIMISEFTQAKLTPGKFFLRDLDDIRVKGKKEPVNVFHLMRPDFIRQQQLIPEFIGEFEAGRKAYKTKNWQVAKNHFFSCLKIKPDDKGAALYVERIDQYLKEAPAEDWDGVFTFTHK